MQYGRTTMSVSPCAGVQLPATARGEDGRPRPRAGSHREGPPSKLVAKLALIALLGLPGAIMAATRPVPDTFTATTTHMTPAGVTLKIDVLEWSDGEARAAAIDALADAGDVSAALRELPTIGYVWPSGSSVGYSLKYAHRESTADGTERVTFVTDRALGSYSFRPWSADSPTSTAALDYSVIELELSDSGTSTGTLSLAHAVTLDDEAQTVSLAAASEADPLLNAVARVPKPYWAREGG